MKTKNCKPRRKEIHCLEGHRHRVEKLQRNSSQTFRNNRVDFLCHIIHYLFKIHVVLLKSVFRLYIAPLRNQNNIFSRTDQGMIYIYCFVLAICFVHRERAHFSLPKFHSVISDESCRIVRKCSRL